MISSMGFLSAVIIGFFSVQLIRFFHSIFLQGLFIVNKGSDIYAWFLPLALCARPFVFLPLVRLQPPQQGMPLNGGFG